MTNKNPFEIRLDILKMAQEMMDREMHMKEHKFNHQVETLRTTSIGDVGQYVDSHAPKMYSPEEVIAKASALYGFVSDSSASSSRTIAASPYKMSDIEEKYRK